MGWRIVQIAKPCKLSVKNNQLIYQTETDESIKLPLEDISVLVLENRQVSFSNYFLSELMENNIVLFTCDASHMPSGILHPYHNHSRYSEMAWKQIEISAPFKKRLWQEIVKIKIKNQACVLSALNIKEAQKLYEISKLVQSGDSRNHEAYAANLYWKYLWTDFNRKNETDIRNAALNYGYAIIRGAMARCVVASGLLPCFGIHHANKLNAFNLVDDLIEPFRPFVDYIVANIDLNNITQLSTEIKNSLISVLTESCLINGEKIGLLYSCQIESDSIATAIKNKDISNLRLPDFPQKAIQECP